uniref:Uncharacterized protein n=1 Tax=Anguilla anguilla TaxID=7936 RepID=A0A0E9WMC1_ANGAN
MCEKTKEYACVCVGARLCALHFSLCDACTFFGFLRILQYFNKSKNSKVCAFFCLNFSLCSS